jgi:carboxypeptidase Q
MKKLSFLFCFIFPFVAHAQPDDSLALRNLFSEIMWNSPCYEKLRTLTKTIGHRISGSPAAARAVQWGKTALEEAGADSVWLQPVEVPLWVRGEEKLSFQWPGSKNFSTVPMISLGNTDGTNGEVLEAPVICVENLEAFSKLSIEDVAGRIVFFNYKFRQDFTNTFEGYGDAVKYRWVALNEAAKKNASGVIIRSIGTNVDDTPHTGSSRYEEGLKHIPAVAIGSVTSDALAEACGKGTVKAQLVSNCGMKGSVMSYNVIGEIRGSEKPDEYILAGGHLDSWDVGEGAHDDGAGCVQSIEVIRAFKALGIQPRHSIRVVLFMNEENGLKGGRAYADSVKQRGESHIMAMESDAGGFSPRGIGLKMSDAQKQIIQRWAPLFLPYGVYDFSQEEGGADISPLQKQGVPVAGLIPDSQRYFELHHSEKDVFEAINHRELKIGAWTMSAFVYLVDKYF